MFGTINVVVITMLTERRVQHLPTKSWRGFHHVKHLLILKTPTSYLEQTSNNY